MRIPDKYFGGRLSFSSGPFGLYSLERIAGTAEKPTAGLPGVAA